MNFLKQSIWEQQRRGPLAKLLKARREQSMMPLTKEGKSFRKERMIIKMTWIVS